MFDILTRGQTLLPLGNFILLGRKIKDLSAVPADFQDGVDDLLCPSLIAVAECFIEQQRDADSLFLTFDKGDPGGQEQLETGAAGELIDRTGTKSLHDAFVSITNRKSNEPN